MVNIEVTTRHGRVRGTHGDGVASFKGIPFAAAPEGPLRFQPPVPPPPWDGVRDATAFGTAPPQPAPAPGVPAAWRPGDGMDCLTLNVWTPDPGGAGLPVMVWVYGGRWMIGASSMPQYDAARLAASGVVVVTFDYRLGFEGFGHLDGVPGNRGLRDQVAALEWVRDNVAAFGGDPGDVTVFGQSAGAASAVFLAAAPAARGLFRRAIAQSVPDGCHEQDRARAATLAVAGAAGAPATLEGLAALPPQALLAAQQAVLASAGHAAPAFTPAPVVDGEFVTGPPWTAAAAAPGVDLVCGHTAEEARGMPGPDLTGADPDAVAAALGLGSAAPYRAAHPGAPDAELFTLMLSDALVRLPTLRVAEAHARAGGRTWLYEFAWRGPSLGACHGVDVPFVFGAPSTRYAARLLGSPPPAGFEELSGLVRAAWTGFAATGDPGWPAFHPDRPAVRVWDDVPSVECPGSPATA
ncbi:carboxylesterase/lipase family protein [Nonomuraea pusilla]|uniref:Carboxylic ester hydrolase n=1 Tax=Nonomuraea pusilla TaxID=46177 RepID=A0A1H7IWR9_9ACTN|nr:carboxylesterase family protein [Nonomuraea pusilla]SEK66828.1 para-nitrobenzyl esterase [Nonomuraea pusilla]